MLVAVILIVLAALYRLLPVWDFSLSNISPVMALAFCGAVYFKDRRMWLVPFVALSLSDLFINHHYATTYGYTWTLGGFVARTLCIVAVLGVGAWVARRRSWLGLLNGTLLGALLFYLVTNTQSWMQDPFYAKTLAGWWQALTTGHPEFPPTILFFRNTLFGDLMFTGLFAGLMEWMARRKGEPSLLDEEPAEGEAPTPEPVEKE